MKSRVAVFAVTALAFLVGCSHEPVSGHVTDKEFTPAHTVTTMVPQYMTTCSTTNNVTSCTQQLMYFLPIDTDYPDEWDIQVEDIDGKKWWIDVPESVYDGVSYGDFFNEADLIDN